MLTGIYCPGCGSQRALHALLNCHFAEAFSYNILATLFILTMLADAGMYLLRIEKYRPYRFLRTNPYVSRVVLVVVILFFILRNIPFFPFNLLAP